MKAIYQKRSQTISRISHNSRSSLHNQRSSSSKKKYLEVYSRKQQSNSTPRQSRMSVASYTPNKYVAQSQSRKHLIYAIPRSSSYKSIERSHPSPHQNVIIKEIIRPIPVHFHYENSRPMSLKKPQFNQVRYSIPSKQEIVMNRCLPEKSTVVGVMSQFGGTPQRNNYAPLASFQYRDQPRFSLRPQPTQIREIRPFYPERNPPRISNSQKNIFYQPKLDQNNLVRGQKIISQQQNLRKSQSNCSNQGPQKSITLSNNNYLIQTIRIQDQRTDVSQNKQQSGSKNSRVLSPSKTINQEKPPSNDSLTITQEDKEKILKENLQIGSSCVCKKILEFMECSQIKINKNNRQALQPKKNILIV